MTGLPAVVGIDAASSRRGGGPSVASVTYTTTSASASAVKAVDRMTRCSSYRGSSRPGVSSSTICVSSVVRMPTILSRVDWGFSLVMLSFWPTMRLSIVDLPTLGFPATVTIPARFIGERYMRASREVPCAPLSQSLEQDAQSPRGAELHEGFAMRCRQWPTLPRPLGRSTIGAVGLNDRVRDGNGCGPYALIAGEFCVRQEKQRKGSSDRVNRIQSKIDRAVLCSDFCDRGSRSTFE